MAEASLDERLGGAFAIAAVVVHFRDAVIQNPTVGQQSNKPGSREWHTNNLGRLSGLKFMRTLWVCAAAHGPFEYSATKPGSTAIGLDEAHRSSGSPLPSSTKSRPSSAGPSTGARSLSWRRSRSLAHSGPQGRGDRGTPRRGGGRPLTPGRPA